MALLAHGLIATEFAHTLDAAPEATARLLTRLGQYQQARAQLAGARTNLERALEIKEAVYGSEHPQVASTLNNLGNVLQQLQGPPRGLDPGTLHEPRFRHPD